MSENDEQRRLAYRPSCGSEGADFMAEFCDRCDRDQAFRDDTGDSCPIVAATMAYDVDHPDYPKEWVVDSKAGPLCTAFKPICDLQHAAHVEAYRCPQLDLIRAGDATRAREEP